MVARSLPATRYANLRPLVAIAVVVLVAVNLYLVALQGALIVAGSDATDFATYQLAASRYADATLYEAGPWFYGFRYSPIAVYPLAVLVLMGETAWRLLHFAALLGLPGWYRLVALASYPFWFDVAAGNTIIGIVVLAFWALRGNRWAFGGFLALSLLIPRPLMIPIVASLLWRRAEWRVPFGVLFAIHALAVLATGYADEWSRRLVSIGGEEIGSAINIAPSVFIGTWWMLMAIPLAIWAFRRGYVATAGLLLQPYWLPYYALMPLADRWHPNDQREVHTWNGSSVG